MKEMDYETIKSKPCVLQFYIAAVPAGFPSPADDYIDNELDLHDYLVAHPASTFLHRVDGRSMEGAGIMDGDIVVVDRAAEAKPGRIVIAVLFGEKTLKRLVKSRQGGFMLISEPVEGDRGQYPLFPVDEAHPFETWGVVVGVVRRYPA